MDRDGSHDIDTDASTSADTDELATVYSDPHWTLEQVINGSTPAVDPGANLSVGVEDTGWWNPSFRAPLGELEPP